MITWMSPRACNPRFTGRMPGASADTLRMRNINANWIAPQDGQADGFEVLVVTEDDQRYTLELPTASAAAFFAMVAAGPVLLFDPVNQTLIAANIVGEWLPADYSRLPRPTGLG